MAETKLPAKAKALFQPARYIILRGGRGSGKSHSVARALILRAADAPLRVLCTREVQKSIAQSVHQLLKDCIEALDLSSEFEVLTNEIRGANGSMFYFAGLSDMTADSLKSYEGIDICWVEEGHNVTRKSWKTLIPTIRKDGSQIIVTYNPQLESDETHQRFTANPPPGTINVEMNWRDNPWFPKVLDDERRHAQKTMPEWEYLNVWEGKCMPAVEGAIYAAEMALAEKRITNVPHDGTLKTHVVFDLGFNDAMAIGLFQRVASELRCIKYLEGNQRTLMDYSAELKALRLDGQPMNWGRVFLPHDGFAKRHQSGRSDADVLRSLGWTVEKSPAIDVESGIKRVREVLPRVWFNADECSGLVECLRRYRRQLNNSTKTFGAPVHDEYSHGADMMRYAALSLQLMTNDNDGWGEAIQYDNRGIV